MAGISSKALKPYYAENKCRFNGKELLAFFTKEGAYMVKDDITNTVIQISDKTDAGWVPDATIVNPFKP